MTSLREAAQQALEAMSSFESGTGGLYEGEFSAEIAALRAALAEPVQEPVAWLTPRTLDSYMRPDLGYETSSKSDYGAFPVYTAPPQRKPLTIERLRDALVASRIIQPAAVEDPDEYDDGVTLFRIEALHRRIT